MFAFAFALSRGMLNAKGEILKNTLFSLFQMETRVGGCKAG